MPSGNNSSKAEEKEPKLAKLSYIQLFKEGRAALSIAILLSVTLVALDILIVNTVLPTILRDLGGVKLYAWAIGAYSLANFITIPIFSVTVAKIGGRRSLVLAILIFMLGATVAALAPQMHWVVAGRFIQGLGAGGFFAIPFGIVSAHYPTELKPRAIGLISAVWGWAAVAGPLFGATILKLFGWHWVFWFNLPAGGIIMILSFWALRKEGPPHDPKAKINFAGPLLFALATALILEAINQPFPNRLYFLVGSLLVFLIFLYRDHHHPTPTIPRDAWKWTRALGVAFISMALTAACFGAAETYLPLMLQGIWNATPLEAGLILTVGSIGWSGASVLVARYADHPRLLTFMGTLMMAMGLGGLLLIVGRQGNLFWVYGAWLVAGIGMGIVVPPYNTVAQDVAQDYPSGVATGVLLLALTWGFSIGPPLAGAFAQYGFGEGFVPSRLGLGVLSKASLEALQEGGIYAVIVSLSLVFIALISSRNMPRSRIQFNKD